MNRQPHTFNQVHYRPEADKNLRQAVIRFISQEFPRLGGPWLVEMFVDRLLSMVETYYQPSDRLLPGQTVWPAVALDERPGDHKPLRQTRLVPVTISVVHQDDIDDLLEERLRRSVLQQAVVRAAKDALAQGGVLSYADLALLFHRSEADISRLILAYEQATHEMVPRRGNIHDIGATLTHKTIICRKAYLEGKPTDVVARETNHSPAAVDRYLLDFARVHFAVIRRGLTPEQTAFAIQRPLKLVQQYLRLIEEFGLNEQQVLARAPAAPPLPEANPVGGSGSTTSPNTERREQIGTSQPVPAFPWGLAHPTTQETGCQ